MSDQVWQWIEERRLATADLLASLPEEDWDEPSLCIAWRVRDVVAHMTLAARARPLSFLVGVIKVGGNFNRYVRDDARARSNQPPSDLITELRSVASSRHHPPGTQPVDPLVDVIVHTLDITTPLGREAPVVPDGAVKAAAERLWTMGFPFRARKRLAGTRIEMTDVDWSAGEGAPLRGRSDAVLLTLAGRRAGIDLLEGEGRELLR